MYFLPALLRDSCGRDTCIIFDSDWNPQNDVQAMARCHRIGQKKRVVIYRLITRNSFESEMFERASRKLGLEQAILSTHDYNADTNLPVDAESPGAPSAQGNGAEVDGGGSSTSFSSSYVSAQEMEQLLRRGAYAMLGAHGEEDDEGESFCEDDIDSILASRSRVVEEKQRSKTESWLSKSGKSKGRSGSSGGGSVGVGSKAPHIKGAHKVSKQTFTANASAKFADVSVDDPEFWKKVSGPPCP